MEQRQEFDIELVKEFGRIANDENKLADIDFVSTETTNVVFNNFINPFLDKMLKKWELVK